MWGTFLPLAQMDLIWWSKFFFNLNTSIKIYNFEMPYLGQFWSNFKKIGTVVIGKTRSLIWVPIIMNSIVSLKNNLEFTFIWNKFCVHPLEMLQFSQNRTRMLLCSWGSIFSSAPLDPTRKGADDAP